MAGTVTALEVQKKNKERVNVYLDGEFAFGLMAIDAARLHRGQALTDDDITALKAQDDVAKAYENALHFLSFRPRSAAEVRRNLAEKQVDDVVSEQAMSRLIEQGLVDDVAFTQFWITNRQEFKPLGARALRFELREKGVPSAIIDDALAEVDTQEAGYRAAKVKARRLVGLDKRAFRLKLGAFLTRRGFDYDTARTVIDRLIEELMEESPNFFNGQQHDDEIQE